MLLLLHVHVEHARVWDVMMAARERLSTLHLLCGADVDDHAGQAPRTAPRCALCGTFSIVRIKFWWLCSSQCQVKSTREVPSSSSTYMSWMAVHQGLVSLF